MAVAWEKVAAAGGGRAAETEAVAKRAAVDLAVRSVVQSWCFPC